MHTKTNDKSTRVKQKRSRFRVFTIIKSLKLQNSDKFWFKLCHKRLGFSNSFPPVLGVTT